MKYMEFFLVLSVISLIYPLSAFSSTQERDSWYIGYGLGGGLAASYEINRTEFTFDGLLEVEGLDKSLKISLNFKVGRTLTHKSLLGFDITAAGQTGSLATVFGTVESQIQINNNLLMSTHFPREEGFFVRGGGGLSAMVNTVEGSGKAAAAQVSGYGLLGAVGYAFWLGKSFNLTLNIDHSRQFYPSGSSEPDSSQFTIIYMGFDWY